VRLLLEPIVVFVADAMVGNNNCWRTNHKSRDRVVPVCFQKRRVSDLVCSNFCKLAAALKKECVASVGSDGWSVERRMYEDDLITMFVLVVVERRCN